MNPDKIKELRNAVEWWEKFAYYAMGKSGHTPLTMNLWLAALFEGAHAASIAALDGLPDE